MPLRGVRTAADLCSQCTARRLNSIEHPRRVDSETTLGIGHDVANDIDKRRWSHNESGLLLELADEAVDGSFTELDSTAG